MWVLINCAAQAVILLVFDNFSRRIPGRVDHLALSYDLLLKFVAHLRLVTLATNVHCVIILL